MKLVLAALVALAISSPVIAATQAKTADTVSNKQIKVKVTPGLSMF